MASFDPRRSLYDTQRYQANNKLRPLTLVPSLVPSLRKAEDGHVFKPSLRFYLAFTAIAAVTLAATIDATSLSIALPIITKQLGGTALEGFWAGTSFLIVSAILMPTYAALSHIFGRKPLMFVASVLFAAGSLIAALSSNMLSLLVGRCIQGAGAGGVLVLGEIIITDLVPLNERGKWLGWLGSMWSIGGVIGPITGGVFAEFVTWRWVFWINLPFIGMGVLLVQLYLKQEAVEGGMLNKVIRVDWIGTVLFTVSSLTLLLPLTWGGVTYDWSAWETVVPLFAGFDGLVGFIYYERHCAREPMIRHTIFSNITLCSTYFQTVIHAINFWAMFYYLPVYYQIVRSFSPLLTGVAMLPQTLVVSPFTVIIGILITMTGQYRWSVYMGWIFTVIGTGFLCILDVDTSSAIFISVNIIVCIGIGTLIPAMNFAIQAAVSAKHCGFAVAFYVFLRQYGEGIGIAVGGVIFQNRIKQNLLVIPAFADLAEQYSKDATALGDVIISMASGVEKDQLVHAYANALRMVWVVMCILSALALCATLVVKGYSMDQNLETEQGFTGEKRPVQLDLAEGKTSKV